MENKADEQPGDLTRARPMRPRPTSARDPREFLVDRVAEHRFTHQGYPEFHVYWKGYPKEDATWEPLSHVLGNVQFDDYWQSLDPDTRRNIRIPENTPIGSDEDGLCVRRAVEALRLPGVDATKFGPWMRLSQIAPTLRAEGCKVRKLRKNELTRRKKLLCIRSAHATGFTCGRGSKSFGKKFQVVYVVKLRTQKKILRPQDTTVVHGSRRGFHVISDSQHHD